MQTRETDLSAPVFAYLLRLLLLLLGRRAQLATRTRRERMRASGDKNEEIVSRREEAFYLRSQLRSLQTHWQSVAQVAPHAQQVRRPAVDPSGRAAATGEISVLTHAGDSHAPNGMFSHAFPVRSNYIRKSAALSLTL